MWIMEDFWGWVLSVLLAILLIFGVANIANASQTIGEMPAYAREVGFETRLFYVAGGSDGAGQVEYICRAFPGHGSNDNTGAAAWQVQRFYYNSSSVLTRISFAGDDDNFNQICDNRASLNYD